MDFWTSDIHWGHKKLAKERGYADVETMDADIIDRINAVASSYLDTIYILGDMSFHKPKDTANILNRIIAQKVLIKGNHDNRKLSVARGGLPPPVDRELSEFHYYLERRFQVTWLDSGALRFEVPLICMFHFPMMHWKDQHKGAWHLHGHLHGTPSGVPGKIMDVGWDKHGKLLTLEDIAAYMDTKPLRINHHEGVGTQ